MDDPKDDEQLQSFIDSNKSPGATFDDLAKLDDHVKKNPRKKGMDAYTKAGLGLVLAFVLVRFVMKAFFG